MNELSSSILLWLIDNLIISSSYRFKIGKEVDILVIFKGQWNNVLRFVYQDKIEINVPCNLVTDVTLIGNSIFIIV